VQSGLGRCGVRGVQLNTEELVELYYNAFNPGEAGKGKTPQISAT